MIELAGVHRSFVAADGSPIAILIDVSLHVRAGEVVAIVGRSGSGKSTLLNILGLLDHPDSGTYLLDGNDTSAMGDRQLAELRARSFGFIFQQFHLLERRTAAQNVAAPLLHASGDQLLRRHAIALQCLDRVGLTGRADFTPAQLSGGEQQRVAVCRSIVRQPHYLLADEPTGSLDIATGAEVLRVMLDVTRETGAALVLVTHDDQVASVADRVLELRAGRLWAA